MTAIHPLKDSLLEMRQPSLRKSDFIFIRTNNIISKVKLGDIKWIHADGNYCYLYTCKRRYVVKISLRKLFDKLTSNRFIRIHKSYVVQLDYIDKIDTQQNVLIMDKQNLPIGRVFKGDLMKKLDII